MSFGIVSSICRFISGDKWHEITSSSEFIRQPGRLIGQVREHLKISTDERDVCRLYDPDGTCKVLDFVFSLEEQRYPAVDNASGVKATEVNAGHGEIIGDDQVVPFKLVGILQQNGLLNSADAKRAVAVEQLSAAFFLDLSLSSAPALGASIVISEPHRK